MAAIELQHLQARLARAQWWPITIPRLYLWIAKNMPELDEVMAWRVAKGTFHRWVWGYERLPWEQ